MTLTHIASVGPNKIRAERSEQDVHSEIERTNRLGLPPTELNSRVNWNDSVKTEKGL